MAIPVGRIFLRVMQMLLLQIQLDSGKSSSVAMRAQPVGVRKRVLQLLAVAHEQAGAAEPTALRVAPRALRLARADQRGVSALAPATVRLPAQLLLATKMAANAHRGVVDAAPALAVAADLHHLLEPILLLRVGLHVFVQENASTLAFPGVVQQSVQVSVGSLGSALALQSQRGRA
eukprot:CAMPEP_0114285312 /NCGR_PEP_ID=MMETSP0059-20121206/5113_1 /TAXON_ID=36894 /ORGANISM="Pyramimonas parkeae, Strain CCMP726" /LENGTH=175 /DNA_ID=CAMNT_0001406189 /DNA_START=534 /DNA_END=1060 /DNA_ORIENTATION=-